MATEEAKSCDLLDMEFNIGLQIAFNYMKQMNLAEDRQVCDKYIRSCVAMRNSTQLKVKIHRNRFFNYLLKTMKRTVQLQKSNPVYLNVNESAFVDEDKNETKQWSADRKSYVAMKVVPGFGVLIYMACTDNPDLGWTENGFSSFTDISTVPNALNELPVVAPQP